MRYRAMLDATISAVSNAPRAAAPGRLRLPAPDSHCARLRRAAARTDARSSAAARPRATTSPRSAMPCSASARTGRGGENRKPWPKRTSQSSRSTTDALALDLLGDQVDAEAAEQVGEIGRMDIGVAAPARLSRRLAGTLTKRKPRVASSRGSSRRSCTIVEREAEAALGERGQAFVLDRAGAAHEALREFEHDRRARSRGWPRGIPAIAGTPRRRSASIPRDCRTGRSRGSSAAGGAPPARSGRSRDCRSSASGRRSPPVRRSRRPA